VQGVGGCDERIWNGILPVAVAGNLFFSIPFVCKIFEGIIFGFSFTSERGMGWFGRVRDGYVSLQQ